MPFPADSVPDPGVVGGQHVRAAELAEQEGLGRPQADAGDGGERTSHVVVAERVHALEVDEAGRLPPGQFQEAPHLASG